MKARITQHREFIINRLDSLEIYRSNWFVLKVKLNFIS